MSLNWKEINLILDELKLEGSRIQKAVQSAYDVLTLKLYGREGAKNLLISLSPNACRLHETVQKIPKTDKPLRFAQFLNSKIVNTRIEKACQLGDNRIVRLVVRQGDTRFFIFIRLWSNAANVIVTDEEGIILDAMKRLPKKGEITGRKFSGELNDKHGTAKREYFLREFPESFLAGLPKDASFNRKIDGWYRQQGGAMSLDALREEARRIYEGRIDRLTASLEKLKTKEADFEAADKLKEYGDLILANLGSIKQGDEWFETNGISIKLDSRKTPAAAAQDYYGQYRRAKNGLEEIQKEIKKGKKDLAGLEETLKELLAETNPLILQKTLKTGIRTEIKIPVSTGKGDAKRPGLSFRRKDWLIMVGRDASENDELLRRHVRGNDLWLHARDFPGSYVFIKQKPGKTVPLDILLDAGNLAIFYSKGRNNGEGNLFYTQVKYLRRVKDGRKGLVIPTQEKNLYIKIEDERLRDLEGSRVVK